MNYYTQNPIQLTSTSNPIHEQLLLRVGKAAELLDVSRSTMYALIHQGLVPAIRIKNSIRVPVDRLKQWIAEQKIAT
jgi:excisionase family DNA binding protein